MTEDEALFNQVYEALDKFINQAVDLFDEVTEDEALFKQVNEEID